MTTEALAPTEPDAPATNEEGEDLVWLDELTPRQIVAELDKYIIGQDDAKKAVAVIRKVIRTFQATDG